MDNVFMLNGTLFVVTDDPAFPPLGSIASSRKDSSAIPRSSDWQILSSAQARETLGPFGGLCVSLITSSHVYLSLRILSVHGVSWLVTDASPSVFFNLYRSTAPCSSRK